MIFGSGSYTYKLVENWARLPEGESFFDVFNIRVDSQDRLHLYTGGTDPIMIFDIEGNLLKAWGRGQFSQAHGGCIGTDGSLYCADFGFHTATRYTSDGKAVLQLGQKGRPSDTGYRDFVPAPDAVLTDFEADWDSLERSGPPFNYPTGMSVNAAGEIYVSDGYGNARVHKFDREGNLLFSWGRPGRGAGQFRVPHSVWVDKYGRVWVCDRQNNRLQIFDAQGKFMDTWGGFDWPCDVFIESDENVYVAELQRRISVLDKNSKLLARFICKEPDKGKAELLAPHSIAVDSRGDLYVGDVAMIVYGIDKKGRAAQKFDRV